MTDTNRDKQTDIPTDSDELAADAASPNRADRANKDPADEEVVDYPLEGNPPHTTTGRFFTAPKFGSAGSGGLENEPGLDKD